MFQSRKGMSLMELTIAVAIICLLAVIVVPRLTKVAPTDQIKIMTVIPNVDDFITVRMTHKTGSYKLSAGNYRVVSNSGNKLVLESNILEQISLYTEDIENEYRVATLTVHKIKDVNYQAVKSSWDRDIKNSSKKP